jgi:ArsR family transcriptional regulator
MVNTSMNVNPMGGPMAPEPGGSDRICCAPVADHALSAGEAHDLAAVLAALADPVRLRIFSIIASQKEICSCNLEEPLDKSQPTISHHTRKLAAAGLIVGEKRGRWTLWRAVPEQLVALGTALSLAEPVEG